MVSESDRLFAQIALKWGWTTDEVINNASHVQQHKDPGKPLSQILLEYEVLTEEQVGHILQRQREIAQQRMQASARFHNPPVNPGVVRATFPGGGGLDFAAGKGGGVAVAMGPSPNPDADPLIGQTLGGCLIQAKIGGGAMANVYLARHETLRRDVVVKVLTRESASKERTVRRFFREARAAARMEHPNLVMVHDVGTRDESTHYMVMQYVDGEDLEKFVQRRGRVGFEEATRIVISVAQALAVAHASQVVHRDVKAENILITQDGKVKLTDFGLAKDYTVESMTYEGAFVGTPLYMAHEIGRIERIDGRADIFSLGMVFYYLVTGTQGFREFTGIEILKGEAHTRLRDPREPFPEIPSRVRRVLGMMLEKHRDQRYPDCEALIRELEALLRDLPLTAPEETFWDRDTDSGRLPEQAGDAPSDVFAVSDPEDMASPALVLAVAVAIVLVFVLIIVFLLLLM
ncbi:MAG: serine/threonine protein kinase [Planctomycetes bacterium]|nr:serine/threonine protein kinase [Planctomycetota bacterium]